MATPIFYTGDTWPPLTGTAKDADGAAVDLSSADSIRMIALGKSSADTIAGTAAFDSDGSDGKWKYTWAADDLSTADTYTPELEVTWADDTTPAKIETFRDDSQTFIVKADND